MWRVLLNKLVTLFAQAWTKPRDVSEICILKAAKFATGIFMVPELVGVRSVPCGSLLYHPQYATFFAGEPFERDVCGNFVYTCQICRCLASVRVGSGAGFNGYFGNHWSWFVEWARNQ